MRAVVDSRFFPRTRILLKGPLASRFRCTRMQHAIGLRWPAPNCPLHVRLRVCHYSAPRKKIPKRGPFSDGSTPKARTASRRAHEQRRIGDRERTSTGFSSCFPSTCTPKAHSTSFRALSRSISTNNRVLLTQTRKSISAQFHDRAIPSFQAFVTLAGGCLRPTTSLSPRMPI